MWENKPFVHYRDYWNLIQARRQTRSIYGPPLIQRDTSGLEYQCLAKTLRTAPYYSHSTANPTWTMKLHLLALLHAVKECWVFHPGWIMVAPIHKSYLTISFHHCSKTPLILFFGADVLNLVGTSFYCYWLFFSNCFLRRNNMGRSICKQGDLAVSIIFWIWKATAKSSMISKRHGNCFSI